MRGGRVRRPSASPAKESTTARLSVARLVTMNLTLRNNSLAHPAKDIAVRVRTLRMFLVTSFMLTKLCLAFNSSNTYHSLARELISARRLCRRPSNDSVGFGRGSEGLEMRIDFVTGEADAALWEEFVNADTQCCNYHRWGWKRVIENSFRWPTYYLMAREDTRVLGILPLVWQKSRLFGSFLTSMPFLNSGGVVAQSESAKDALLAES